MPATGTIVINDEAAVARTFTPKGTVNGVSRFEFNPGTMASHRYLLTYAKQQSDDLVKGRTKDRWKLEMPILDVDGVVLDKIYVDVVITKPVQATTALRSKALAFGKNLLAHATATSTIVDDENYW